MWVEWIALCAVLWFLIGYLMFTFAEPDLPIDDENRVVFQNQHLIEAIEAALASAALDAKGE
jgi:hypothetical protein